MKYSELIQISQGFQASVNLEYDLNKIEKVCGYIPTDQSVKILDAFLRSYYYNSEPRNRATVLVGPYGRGKSHLLLVLAALTSLDLRIVDENDSTRIRQIQYDLCDKIARVNAETGALAREIVDSNIRTLPVIVNSNTTDINQAFLVAISDALRKAGLDNLLPSTYFEEALPVIDKWETSFQQMYAQLCEELKKYKTTVADLKVGLRQYDQSAYDLFCKCHTSITSADFNPLINMDVVKLYQSMAHALQEQQTGYCGITVIFDEFSKFLEANLDKSKMLNFKIIQDMAEAATRSGKNQLHFTCITHKEILDYSTSDSFKTVEGRFRKLRFVASSEQSYELISNALEKQPAYTAFQERYADEFSEVATESARLTLFQDLSEEAYQQRLVYGCFPLAPLTAYALLRISELVGQNERTLFTFLTQNESYSLGKFLGEDIEGFHVMTVEYIYGYFEELFKKEVFNTRVHSIWAKTDAALRQVTDKDQRKILMAIAIIQMIDIDQMKATPAHIKATLMMAEEIFAPSIKNLLKMQILTQKDSSEYALLTATGVSVQNAVDNYVKTKLPRINVCEVLGKACDLGFVLPRAYNDNYGMTRCFRNIYMDASVLIQYSHGKQLFEEYPHDGLVIHVVCHQEEQQASVMDKLKVFVGTPQIVLCLTTRVFTHELLLKRYEAAAKLCDTQEANTDPRYKEELELYMDDLRRRIHSVVEELYGPSSVNSVFANCNGEIQVRHQVDLNRAISSVCAECYSMTPVVNNEMVNKRNLNTQNTKARDLVVGWILRDTEGEEIPCIPGYGPEVSIFKSAFQYKGLHKATVVDDVGLNAVLKIISEFIDSCGNECGNFADLYKTLTAPPYGMRRGIIPLYIAYAMRQNKQNVILYFKGKEVELSAATLSHLNLNPENYQILLEKGVTEQICYLDELEKLFKPDSKHQNTSINRIYQIVRDMQNWIRAFPEYTKKHKIYLAGGEEQRVSGAVEALRSELMRFDVNARDLLFHVLPQRMNTGEDLTRCFEEIKEAKIHLDTHISVFRTALIQRLTDLFIPNYEGSFATAVRKWYDDLPLTTKQHLFDADTNALLKAISKQTSYDDEKMLDDLVYAVAVIAIDDWNDRQQKLFVANISESVAKVNGFQAKTTHTAQDGTLSVSVDGMHIDKVFSTEAITPLGKTMLNNLRSIFDDYNNALEPEEQLAILAKLIGEIIH